VWNQYSHQVNAEVTFYIYRFPTLFLDVFWEQQKSRFVLADDLHVAGHGTVVQPAIIFGCKQAQQYSRTHQLGFVRAVSWSAQNVESYWSHVHITMTVEYFSFHAFYKNTARFDVLSKSLNVTNTTNLFLVHFRCVKKLQNFLMLLGIMHATPPLPKPSLISSYQQQKNWPKISVVYFTKWFQSIFTVGGWRTYSFNRPLLAPAYKGVARMGQRGHAPP